MLFTIHLTLTNWDISNHIAGADLGQILTDFLDKRRRRKLLEGPWTCSPRKFFRF